MKSKVFIAMSMLVLAIACVGCGLMKKQAPDSTYSCVAGKDEICASPEFYADFQRWEVLKDDVQTEQKTKVPSDLQEKLDRLSGMTNRLQQSMPHGYDWNIEKKRFVKAAPIAPLPPPVPADAKK